MLLKEILGKDMDSTEHEKLVLVQLFMNGEDGGSIKPIFKKRSDDVNIATAKETLLDLKAIEPTDIANFYRVTDTGKAMLIRASLLDDNEELIDSNIKPYMLEVK